MSERTFRGFTLLCLLVNAAIGSPRFHSIDEHRNPRHASCASCRRERPDALVSWVSPPRTDYHDLESESQPWQDDRFFRTSRNSQPSYEGRGTPSVDGPRRTCKRESSIGFEGDFDFNVAPPQAAASHGMAGIVTRQEPRLSLAKDPSSITYGKPNFFSVVKSQSESEPSNRYNIYGIVDKDSHLLRFVTPFNSPGRNLKISHGGDRNTREFMEEEVPVQREQYPGMQFNLNGYKKMYQVQKVQTKDLEREKFGGYVVSEMNKKGGEMEGAMVKRMNEETKKIVQLKTTPGENFTRNVSSESAERITRSFPVIMQVPRKITSGS